MHSVWNSKKEKEKICMHCMLGDTTLSQLAFPRESDPTFLWEKFWWNNEVVGEKKKKEKNTNNKTPMFLTLWYRSYRVYNCSRYFVSTYFWYLWIVTVKEMYTLRLGCNESKYYLNLGGGVFIIFFQQAHCKHIIASARNSASWEFFFLFLNLAKVLVHLWASPVKISSRFLK